MGTKYFEEGCLCVLSGKIEKAEQDDPNAYQYYLDKCTCTRHPESSSRHCWDKDPVARKDALALIEKRHPSLN